MARLPLVLPAAVCRSPAVGFKLRLSGTLRDKFEVTCVNIGLVCLMLSLRSCKPFICCSNVKLEGKNCSCFESLFVLYFIGYHKERLCILPSSFSASVARVNSFAHSAVWKLQVPQDFFFFFYSVKFTASSQQATLYDMNLIKLGPTGSLQFANCTTEKYKPYDKRKSVSVRKNKMPSASFLLVG